MKKRLGQSLAEVILAVSIFLVFAGGAGVVVLGSLDTTRMASEETFAAGLAVEGQEAVDSIRNFGWERLTDGTFGISHSVGEWELVGENDAVGKFTREVQIETVMRDTEGNITDAGLNADPEAKKITVKVSWQFKPARENSIEIVRYLADWQTSEN
jgi:type II secretory pathway pseudopilin PulG